MLWPTVSFLLDVCRRLPEAHCFLSFSDFIFFFASQIIFHAWLVTFCPLAAVDEPGNAVLKYSLGVWLLFSFPFPVLWVHPKRYFSFPFSFSRRPSF